MKKYILSPLFAPIFTLNTWLVFVCVLFVFYSDSLTDLLSEDGVLEKTTNFFYLPLLLALIFFCKPFMQNKKSKIEYGLYIFLSLAAFLREQGIQHWLTTTDTTAFKSRFFLNPNNPLEEKIVAGFLLILFASVLVYFAKNCAHHLIKTFFQMNTLTWSIATLCTWGVFIKFVDRFPSNYKKYMDTPLPADIKVNLNLIEETGEMFLPVIAAIILGQYWLLHKKEN